MTALLNINQKLINLSKKNLKEEELRLFITKNLSKLNQNQDKPQ